MAAFAANRTGIAPPVACSLRAARTVQTLSRRAGGKQVFVHRLALPFTPSQTCNHLNTPPRPKQSNTPSVLAGSRK
eukprot:417213-Prymnesium_polylepis.1